ncbi:MAG: ABC transporter ATP-binding protein [Desulfomonile tiedjei]|nr:ABC transporter ATP-binding protein [Desulfomonile tiedjei]
MCEDGPGEEFLRNQAWNYFQVHAAQRLTTFNFYIVISALLSTALVTTFHKDYQSPWLGFLVGIFLPLISFVFWKLDKRNKELVRGAEAALKFFENQTEYADSENVPHIAKIFNREEHETQIKRKETKGGKSVWEKHFSYSDCFRWIFLSFGILGLLGAVTSLKKLLCG